MISCESFGWKPSGKKSNDGLFNQIILAILAGSGSSDCTLNSDQGIVSPSRSAKIDSNSLGYFALNSLT